MCLLREPHSESWLKETVLKKDKDKIQCVCERERDHCLVLCPLSSAVHILIIWTHPLQIKKDRHTHPHTPLITLCHQPKNACPRALILKETQSLESDTALCLLLWSSVCYIILSKDEVVVIQQVQEAQWQSLSYLQECLFPCWSEDCISTVASSVDEYLCWVHTVSCTVWRLSLHTYTETDKETCR